MASFHLLKYLNKAKYIVFLFTLIGVFFVYNYATSNQRYTSKAIIQYKTLDETTGLLSSGESVDTREIYSSTVVQNVINDLNVSSSMENIRSSTSITEVIPYDETQRKNALLEKGEEYVYYPSKYLVSFSAPGVNRGDYVRDILDSTLQNYFAYYSEKYVEVAAMPNNAEDVIKDQYDYIESVELVASCVSEIVEYLNVKVKLDPEFRASSTGYNFEDLLGQYLLINNNTIPALYEMVFESHLSKDDRLLRIKYQNRIDDCQEAIESSRQEMDTLKKLLDSYSQHSQESIKYYFNNNESSSILFNVNGGFKSDINDTTYDAIISRYVALDTKARQLQTEKDYNQQIVDIFDGTSDVFSAPTSSAAKITESDLIGKLQSTVKELNAIYEIFKKTLKEYNAYKGAGNIAMLTSITVSAALNVKLYIALAAVLFLFVGCAMSVIIGRFNEYFDYMMYVDKKTNLPNRIRCDAMIDQYARSLLNRDFVLGIINLDSLAVINKTRGRGEGDEQLVSFSGILRLLSSAYGFIAYNGSSQFFCLLENCGEDKARLFQATLKDKVDAYNVENSSLPITYSISVAGSSMDNCYDIRKLILLARQRMSDEAEHGGAAVPDSTVSPASKADA